VCWGGVQAFDKQNCDVIVTMMQQLGRGIPYVEATKLSSRGGKVVGADEVVPCNVIVMGAGRERMGRELLESLEHVLREEENEEDGHNGILANREGEFDDGDLNLLRTKLKASRKHDDDDDDDDSKCNEENVCAEAAAEELRGLGIDELTRRINALHAASAGQEQQVAASGREAAAYFNRVRRSRCRPHTSLLSPLAALPHSQLFACLSTPLLESDRDYL
jgi:hypothetical protein